MPERIADDERHREATQPPAAQRVWAAVDLAAVERIVEETGRSPEAAIPILQAIQEQFGYLPQEALEHVCRISRITPAALAQISTFYAEFRHRPVGKHILSVCHGTACHVKGAPRISEVLAELLKIPASEDTDPEGQFTVRKVGCLGCCSLAPVMQVDDIIYGHLTPEGLPGVLHDFLAQTEKTAAVAAAPVAAAGADGEIRICLDSCCTARGTQRVYEALQRTIADTGARAVIKRVGCVIVCNETPLVEVVLPGGRRFLYARVTPEDARDVVLRHFRPRGFAHRIKTAVTSALECILTDEAWEPVTRYSATTREPAIAAVLGRQVHVSTENYGLADPTNLDEYLAAGGFEALRQCRERLSPEQVIEMVRASGLRGRGGAGFPTAAKWQAVRAAGGDKKYIICNGDEGDPGAFMDRMILESFPYRVIEGMAIAAYAVGAEEGYLYIRAEYPFAVKRMREALGRCQERGILEATGYRLQATGAQWPRGQGDKGTRKRGDGESRLDPQASNQATSTALKPQTASLKPLSLKVVRGAGAFVCGEETALIASIEGRRSAPRLRPPYPAERGLRGFPTLINNVETFALVPAIIRDGPEAFARLGTAGSKGTKVFALAGKTVRGGLIEVPMGITLRQIVEEIGGGIAGGRRFKAALIGGPSGGCVPAELADAPIDYESLAVAGTMMGSGGLVVLDDADCMVDVARYFLEFTQAESCGKCTFCRIGTRQMLDILTRMCAGRGRKGDVEELERLAALVKQGSLCGLGKTAPNPVLSALRYFGGEFEAHLAGRCPAGRCKPLIRYYIIDDCIGCTRCAQHCPADAIAMRPYQKHEIDAAKCVRCGTCKTVCTEHAVKVE